MSQDLKLHIQLENPPAGVDFGLQKGSGNNYETIQTQRSKSGELHFELEVKIKNMPSKSEEPNFVGPFVQGPTAAKFVYIDIGTYAGQRDTVWSRRLKIPLSGITWEMIDEVQNNTGLVIETSVPGTGKDGGPNCATVKPFAGWKLNSI